MSQQLSAPPIQDPLNTDPKSLVTTPTWRIFFQQVASLLSATVGPKGDKGDTGSVGPAGSDGTAATVNAGTTTTLSPGSSATVNNSGSISAAIFDFGVPRGADGTNGKDGKDGKDGTGDNFLTMQVFN